MLRQQAQEPARVARRRPLVHSTAPCRVRARAGAHGRTCRASSRRRDRHPAWIRSGSRERCPDARLRWNAPLSCGDATAAWRRIPRIHVQESRQLAAMAAIPIEFARTRALWPASRASSKTFEPPPHAQAASANKRDRLGGSWLSTTNLMRRARPHGSSGRRHRRLPRAHPVSYTHLTLPTKRIV